MMLEFHCLSLLPGFIVKTSELVKPGIALVENIGSIDNSSPERILHEEYMGKELAKARLLMPLKLVNLECKVGDIEKTAASLNDNLDGLVSVLKNTLFNPDKESSMNLVEAHKYIS